jgi:hypothetical protein
MQAFEAFATSLMMRVRHCPRPRDSLEAGDRGGIDVARF